MRVAIHQPTFFPWIGLFHKILHSDVFIFFDHVQNPRCKSWLTRNKILLDDVHWITIPTHKSGLGMQPISEVRINYEHNFTRKHLGMLRSAYEKSPYYAENIEAITSLYAEKRDLLCDFNRSFIESTCTALGIKSIFMSSRDIVAEHPELATLAGNELVLELCRAARASEYLSGSGCLDFIKPESFEQNGIAFYFQHFEYAPYAQPGSPEFVSHLSCLDTLFSIGKAGAAALIAPPMLSRPVPPEQTHAAPEAA